MIAVVELVGQVAGEVIPIRFVAARLHYPIDDIQPKPGVAEPGLLIEKASASNSRHVTTLVHYRFQLRRGNPDFVGGFDDGK